MLTTIFSFLAYALVLAAIPGPDNIFVLTQSVQRGAAAGISVTFGLCTGLLVHTAAVVLGLAALVAASPLAFHAIKMIGAAYLVYLAWKAFTATSTPVVEGGSVPGTAAQLYRRGIIMNITNPKVAMFFLAFLPQFTNPAIGPLPLQLLMFGALFVLATLCVFLILSLAAGKLGSIFLRSEKATSVMNKIAGVVFLLLAARLLWD